MSDLNALQSQINITFENLELYERAFVHKSYTNENHSTHLKDNERLEFLGDAVLELITTEVLFEKYPDKPEGVLTAIRAAVVRGRHLAKVAKDLNLGQYLKLSKGELKSGGREKDYILANTVEALIGAIYLDQGYTTSSEFINTFILNDLDEMVTDGQHIDPKTLFQELAQEKVNITPEYKIISESGPDHDKEFEMGVYLADEIVATGKGSSKQKAELAAAEEALEVKGWS